MTRCTCSIPTWFRCVAKTLVDGTIALMPLTDFCWTPMCFGRLERTYASILRAERPPHVRHGLPRIAYVALAHDRRHLQDRVRLLPSRPDPFRGVLHRAIRTSRIFPRLCPALSYCVFRTFCHSFGPHTGSVHVFAIVSKAGGFRCPTQLCRRMSPVTRVGGFRNRHRPSHTRCRRQTVRLAGRDRRAPIFPGSWPPGSSLAKAIAHLSNSPSGCTDAENHDRPTKCDRSMPLGHGIDFDGHYHFRRRAASEVGPGRT